jgi:hypothetical protein
MTDPFTCPRCKAESHHPKDKQHGYCGRCHDFTGEPVSIAALDDRIQSLLVTGIGQLRLGRLDEALMVLQEALAAIELLPTRDA